MGTHISGIKSIGVLDTPSKKSTNYFTDCDFCIKAPCVIIITTVIADFISRTVTRFLACSMNTKRRSTLLFTVCVVLFLLHQYLQKIVKVSLPVMDNYLDPLLLMPILLPLIVWERQLIHKKINYTLPLTHVFGYFLLVSILCEIILPLWNRKMTADVRDILFYALGSIIYVASTRNNTGTLGLSMISLAKLLWSNLSKKVRPPTKVSKHRSASN